MAVYDDGDRPVLRTIRRLLRTLGITSSDDKNKQRETLTRRESYSRYTEQEEKRFADKLFRGLDYREATKSDTMSFVQKAITSSASIIKDLRSLYTLNPEIKQIERILVGSIMSPNDMQTDAVNISVNVDVFSDGSNTELSKVINDYFNDEFKLGVKLTEWIGNALIKNGAQPIMIIPRSNVRALAALNKVQGRMSSDFDGKIHTYLSVTNEELQINNAFATLESEQVVVDQDEYDYAFNTAIECKQALASAESIDVSRLADDLGKVNTKYYDENNVVDELFNYGKAVMENLGSKHKNTIHISTDVSKIKDGKTNSKAASDDLAKLFEKHFIATDGEADIFNLNDNPMDGESNDRPSILKLPAESIAVVHVPGNPEEHIGYFVMVTASGEPMTCDDCSGMLAQRTLTDLSKEATFGTNSVIYRSNGFNSGQRYDSASLVFGTTVKRLLERQLSSKGLSNVQLGTQSSFINSLFLSFLQRREVQLVFVPASLMVYMRYEHRDDGTGKSLLEDVFFTYALRTTMMIAKSMAAIRNATDKTVIEFDASNQTNILQTIDQLKELYIAKQTTNISADPQSIIHDITNKSISFKPKNIMGLNEFDVTVQQVAENHAAPDDTMIEKLSDMGISGLGVPHAALNQVSENDYAVSIVTTNLFFADLIRCRQRQTIEFVEQLIKQILKYDRVLQKDMIRVLRKTGEEFVSKTDAEGNTANIIIDNQAAGKLIIDNIKVNLPSPNISTNKAHVKEISEFNSAVDTILNGLYPDEILQDSGSDAKTTYTAMKALIKQQMMRAFIESVGFQGATDIPSFEDLDIDPLHKVLQQVFNVKIGLANQVDALKLKKD